MNTRMRLMLASVLAAVIVGNGLPVLGALLGVLSWGEVVRGLPVLNLVFVLPAVPAALASAWIHAHDPDLDDGAPALLSASLVLVTFAAYFLATLAWLPVVEVLSSHVLPPGLVMPQLPQSGAVVLFQTLLLAIMGAVPAWLLGVASVRWAKTRSGHGRV